MNQYIIYSPAKQEYLLWVASAGPIPFRTSKNFADVIPRNWGESVKTMRLVANHPELSDFRPFSIVNAVVLSKPDCDCDDLDTLADVQLGHVLDLAIGSHLGFGEMVAADIMMHWGKDNPLLYVVTSAPDQTKSITNILDGHGTKYFEAGPMAIALYSLDDLAFIRLTSDAHYTYILGSELHELCDTAQSETDQLIRLFQPNEEYCVRTKC